MQLSPMASLTKYGDFILQFMNILMPVHRFWKSSCKYNCIYYLMPSNVIIDIVRLNTMERSTFNHLFPQVYELIEKYRKYAESDEFF